MALDFTKIGFNVGRHVSLGSQPMNLIRDLTATQAAGIPAAGGALGAVLGGGVGGGEGAQTGLGMGVGGGLGILGGGVGASMATQPNALFPQMSRSPVTFSGTLRKILDTRSPADIVRPGGLRGSVARAARKYPWLFSLIGATGLGTAGAIGGGRIASPDEGILEQLGLG